MQGLDTSPASRARVVVNQKLAQTYSHTAFDSGGDGASYSCFSIEPHCGLKGTKRMYRLLPGQVSVDGFFQSSSEFSRVGPKHFPSAG